MGLFDPEVFVFEDKDVLRDDYRPDSLDERQKEIQQCASALRPVVQNNQPDNLFLYGLTGVGKTAATHVLIEELLSSAEEYDAPLEVVELNCTGLSSSYQVAVSLVNEMRSPNHQLTTINLNKGRLPETGYPQKRVFEELRDDLETAGETVLIILDEIDNIGTDDDLLYELPRARSNYDFSTRLGVIGISNDFKFRDNLSSKVKDTLAEKEVHFKPYDATQLTRILEKRAKQAFSDEVLDQGVVQLCAALAAQDSGSARQALRLLREAGDFAEKEAAESGAHPQLKERHVREAETEIQRQQVVEGMESLTIHGKLVLLAITDLATEGETSPRTKTILGRYQQLAHTQDTDPLGRRGLHNHLSDLKLQGILAKYDVADGHGKYNEYELDVTIRSAIDALETEFADLDELREKARASGVA